MKDRFGNRADEYGYTLITRSQLHKAVDRTLEMARNNGARITKNDRHCYHAVADDVELIAKPWEMHYQAEEAGRCGCLVGSLRMKRGQTPYPPERAATQNTVGYAFPSAVDEVLGATFTTEVLRVSDD